METCLKKWALQITLASAYIIKNTRSGLNFSYFLFFSYFYFIFYLFFFILFLEPGLEGQDHAVTLQVTSHMTHRRM